MEKNAVYSQAQHRRATNLSALIGWFIFSLGFSPLNGNSLQGWFSLLPWIALFGLLIAFACCWIIVAPILRFAMRKSVTWCAAALWGALGAGIIAGFSIILGRIRGYQISQNPNFNSTIGGGEYVRSVDGILTLYGWQVVAQNTAKFVLLGVFTALVIRAIIGPGKPQS